MSGDDKVIRGRAYKIVDVMLIRLNKSMVIINLGCSTKYICETVFEQERTSHFLVIWFFFPER